MSKACPMCGEQMKLKDRTLVHYTAGTSEPHTKQFQEWVCPECDYFEEFDPEVDDVARSASA
ncbi:MAG: hypothetical protein U0Q12_18975 [Vicinamibacterales bacterium]